MQAYQFKVEGSGSSENAPADSFSFTQTHWNAHQNADGDNESCRGIQTVPPARFKCLIPISRRKCSSSSAFSCPTAAATVPATANAATTDDAKPDDDEPADGHATATNFP